MGVEGYEGRIRAAFRSSLNQEKETTVPIYSELRVARRKPRAVSSWNAWGRLPGVGVCAPTLK